MLGVVIMKKSQSKVYKSGNGQVVSIRKKDLQKSGIQIGDDLDVEVKNSQITLIKANTFKSEWDRFINSDESYDRKEYQWERRG